MKKNILLKIIILIMIEGNLNCMHGCEFIYDDVKQPSAIYLAHNLFLAECMEKYNPIERSIHKSIMLEIKENKISIQKEFIKNNFIASLAENYDICEIEQYSMFEKMLIAEIRLGATFYPFYHGMKIEILLAYKLFSTFVSRLTMKPYFQVRFPDDENVDFPKNTFEFISKYKSQMGFEFDRKPEIKKQTISTSYSLFLDPDYESAAFFYDVNSSITSSRDIIAEILIKLKNFGVKDSQIKSYIHLILDLKEKLNSKKGGMFQIFIHEKKINDLAYFSKEYGIYNACVPDLKYFLNLFRKGHKMKMRDKFLSSLAYFFGVENKIPDKIKNMLNLFYSENIRSDEEQKEYLKIFDDLKFTAPQIRLLCTSPDFFDDHYVKIFHYL
jgi:hypothetical protein